MVISHALGRRHLELMVGMSKHFTCFQSIDKNPELVNIQ